jgi:hypothetical protein
MVDMSGSFLEQGPRNSSMCREKIVRALVDASFLRKHLALVGHTFNDQ